MKRKTKQEYDQWKKDNADWYEEARALHNSLLLAVTIGVTIGITLTVCYFYFLHDLMKAL